MYTKNNLSRFVSDKINLCYIVDINKNYNFIKTKYLFAIFVCAKIAT